MVFAAKTGVDGPPMSENQNQNLLLRKLRSANNRLLGTLNSYQFIAQPICAGNLKALLPSVYAVSGTNMPH